MECLPFFFLMLLPFDLFAKIFIIVEFYFKENYIITITSLTNVFMTSILVALFILLYLNTLQFYIKSLV